jgi:hypothetical protein
VARLLPYVPMPPLHEPGPRVPFKEVGALIAAHPGHGLGRQGAPGQAGAGRLVEGRGSAGVRAHLCLKPDGELYSSVPS